MALFPLTSLKTDNGIVRTKSLFYELSYDNPGNVLFTLKEHDIEGPDGSNILSLGRLFVEHCIEDPSEYDFSQKVFGSWKVWDRLRNAAQLEPHVEAWREEADIARKAMAFRSVIEEVKTNGRSKHSASKFLIEEPWKGKQGPAADKRKARKKVMETAEEAFERVGALEDLERLRDEGHLN